MTSDPPSSSSQQSGTVLVVDDEATNRALIRAILRRTPLKILEAADGLEAIEIAAREFPDLILMDVMMPRMDGLQATAHLKANPALRHIPIVIVTALDSKADRHRGLEAGAEDFLTTPVDHVELSLRVENFLRLKKANDELDRQREINEFGARQMRQLSHFISHEIQAPLRQIEGFATLLKRHNADKFDAKGRDYLARVVQLAERLRNLTQDVLAMTRMDADAISVVMIEPASLLLEIKLERSEALHQSGAILDIGALPKILGNETLIRQLLINLLDNALKYADPARPPHLQVRARREGSIWHFEFEDNGLGIPAQAHKRVFEMFEVSPNRPSGVPGTGIGLALCRKIVETHQGSIWITDNPVDGLTVHFTLPALPEEPRP